MNVRELTFRQSVGRMFGTLPVLLVLSAVTLSAEPEDYKKFVKESREYTLGERRRLQNDLTRLRKAGPKLREKAKKAAVDLRAVARGGLLTKPIPEIVTGRAGDVTVSNFAELKGTLGRPGDGVGKVLKIVGDDEMIVAMLYQTRWTNPNASRRTLVESRTLTGKAGGTVSTTRPVTIIGWPTDGLKVGGRADLPPVVELVGQNPEVYRAVPLEELRPYLRGKKIIGLKTGRRANP